MKPLKCLAITNSYPPDHAGGYELGACNLLETLAKHFVWENTVVASVRKEKSHLTSSTQLTGFFPGKLGPEFQKWRTKRALIRNHTRIVSELKAEANEADLIFIFNPRRLVLPEWTSVFELDKPIFVFVSDFWPQDPWGTDIFHSRCPINAINQLKDSELRALYSSVPKPIQFFSKFSGAIFGSEFMKETHAETFSSIKNQSMAHWGIDIDAFPEVPFSSERLKTFGFCGRPEKEKGLDLALDAFLEISADDDDLRFLIASDLPGSRYGRSIIKKISSDPKLASRVTPLGHIPHAKLHSEFYSKIGVLLFPSVWREPFALTVLEAMASGVLVVASNTGGTPEIVDLSTGYSFDPQIDGSLVKACRDLLKTPDGNRERIQRGTQRIRSNHSLPFMAEMVNDFIRYTLYGS